MSAAAAAATVWHVPFRLHRAIVGLPNELCERERPLQERIVFFESNSHRNAAMDLEKILAAVWCVDTTHWCERGNIYNIYNARERMREGSYSAGETTDLCLLETGAGGDAPEAVGPERIHYARADDVDLFVTPRVAKRLRELLTHIEALYAAEPARRAAGSGTP